MSKFSVFSIGRSKEADLQLEDMSVSRIHAELVQTADGKFYLADCGSSGGTYIQKDGNWVAHQQAYVARTDLVKLGDFQTSIQDFALLIKEGAGGKNKKGGGAGAEWTAKDELPDGPVLRDSITGEIIGKEN